jgi:hypothetical protein
LDPYCTVYTIKGKNSTLLDVPNKKPIHGYHLLTRKIDSPLSNPINDPYCKQTNGFEFLPPSQAIPEAPKSSLLTTAWIQAKQSFKRVSFLNKSSDGIPEPNESELA